MTQSEFSKPMIFDVSPEVIAKLGSKQLVELLRRLIYLEAQSAGLHLRAVSVPLNITVSDGGEDARVGWIGGADQTDYLPCRFSIFQSKATDPGASGWGKEVWTKATQKKSVPKKKLNKAVMHALSNGGAFIGFTSASLVGPTLDKYVQAIRDGITKAEGAPADLAAIEIYDANKIAAWASKFPSIAVWLNQTAYNLPLQGFQTLEAWNKQALHEQIEFIGDDSPRFFIGSAGASTFTTNNGEPVKDAIAFEQARERIFQFLEEPGRSVELSAPLG